VKLQKQCKTQQKRNYDFFNPFMLGLTFGFVFLLRKQVITSKFAQKLYVKHKFSKPFKDVTSLATKRYLKTVRITEVNFLKSFFDNQPTIGPLVIVGVSGSGVKELLSMVIANRQNTFFFKMKAHHVTSAQEFVLRFCEELGYVFPTWLTTEWAQFVLRSPPRVERVTHGELEEALKILLDTIEEKLHAKHREEGYMYPVFIIDGIFPFFEEENFKKDVYYLKLSDWFIYLYDKKLAHVVFVSNRQFLDSILNTEPLMMRGRYMYINFPVPTDLETVSNFVYLETMSRTDETKKEKGDDADVQILDMQQARWMTRCLGSHVEDIERAIAFVIRGYTVADTLARLVSESILYIESILETLLCDAAKSQDDGSKKNFYGTYLRYWRLIALLAEGQQLNRRNLITKVFREEHIEELNYLADLEVVSYSPLKGGSIEDILDIGNVYKFIEQVREPVTNNRVLKKEINNFLPLGGIMVSASSGRMSLAFAILSKYRIRSNIIWVRNKLKLYQLHDKVDEFNTLINSFQENQTTLFHSINTLANSYGPLSRVLGVREVEQKIKNFKEEEVVVKHKLESLFAKKEKAEAHINLLNAFFLEDFAFESHNFPNTKYQRFIEDYIKKYEKYSFYHANYDEDEIHQKNKDKDKNDEKVEKKENGDSPVLEISDIIDHLDEEPEGINIQSATNPHENDGESNMFLDNNEEGLSDRDERGPIEHKEKNNKNHDNNNNNNNDDNNYKKENKNNQRE